MSVVYRKMYIDRESHHIGVFFIVPKFGTERKDMDNSRETNEVVMAVQKAAFLADPFFKLTVVGSVFLITFLARMVKEGKLKKGEFKNVQEFIKASQGKYTIINVPFSKNENPWKVETRTINGTEVYIIKNDVTKDILIGKDGKERTWNSFRKAEKEVKRLNTKENLVLDELKELDIRHIIMPDLNEGDGMVQVAVYDEDKERFNSWLEKYLFSKMRGGEMELQELEHLTEGQVSIFTIPMEGKENIIKEEFEKLGINYSLLPDLQMGDGNIQIAVYDKDKGKFQAWLERYVSSQLKGGEKELQNLSNLSDGKYSVFTVPLEGKEELLKNDLGRLGINYSLLPDLQVGDGNIQIVIYNKDKEKFSSWFGRYVSSQMQGGRKSLQKLMNLTEGNTRIISIPFEGKEKDVFEDFKKLGINYAVLPDLHVGDGEIQLVIATADMPQVQLWYEMYTKDQKARGIDVPEMKAMDMNEYTKSAEMTEEQYVDTADEELKKANEKYEGREPGEIEKSVAKQEKEIRRQNDAAYEKYHTDQNYIEISIDNEALVEQSHFQKKEAASENGLFYSRVPGTWINGKNPELTLILPNEQVFMVNDGKTYIGFLEKGKRVDIRSLDGNPTESQFTGERLYEKYYDEAIRTRGKKEQMTKSQSHVQKNQHKNFNNFNRRNYDFSDLEDQLLNAEASGRENAGNKIKSIAEKVPKNPVKVK